MTKTTPLQILSAGAPKAGVKDCAEVFRDMTGTQFQIEFATGPAIQERVTAGHAMPDVIVAPYEMLQGFITTGHVQDNATAELGAIHAGMAVPDRTKAPDLSTIHTFREALVSAEALVFNRASSGLHLEQVLHQLNLVDELADRIVRTDTGAEAMAELAKLSSQPAIAFGQITEIKANEHLGVQLVGPLPAQVGKQTSYQAGKSTSAVNPKASSNLIRFFASEKGQRLLHDAGIE